MEELDQSSLHPLIKHPKTDTSRPGIEPQPHSTKEQANLKSDFIDTFI
jgi:hypothetical protein